MAAQLAAFQLDLVRVAGELNVAGGRGAASLTAWLAETLRISPATAAAMVRLAAFTGEYRPVDAGLRAGTVNVEQARVIAAAVEALPSPAATANVQEKAAAEHHRWLAAEFMAGPLGAALPPKELGLLGVGILEHVAPDVADELERRSLERSEREAHERRSFTMSAQAIGGYRLSGHLTAEAAAVVREAIESLTAPRVGHAAASAGLGAGFDEGSDPRLDGDVGVDHRRSPTQQRADALVEVCKLALRTGDLPAHGGDRPQLAVTIPFDVLAAQLHARKPDPRKPDPSQPATGTPAAGAPATGTPETGAPAATFGVGQSNAGDAAASQPDTKTIAADPVAAPMLNAGTLQVSQLATGTPATGTPAAEAPAAEAPAAEALGAEALGAEALGAEALGAGTLDTGERITPAAVRRLACDANIIPIILGNAGQVLDAGRSQRLVTGALRRALVIRDGGCAFPGCDRRPRWTEGHHITHWAAGGPTNLDNTILLCGFHHRVIHHSDWTAQLGDDGIPEFRPPAWMDPDRKPRRNHRYLLSHQHAGHSHRHMQPLRT